MTRRAKTQDPSAGRSPGRRASPRRIERLIAEALVDAYGEGEERVALFTRIEDELALPFETSLLGVSATVERVDLTDAGEIVAVCRRGARRQAIPLLRITLPKPPPVGSEWIEAYRRWARRT